MKGKVNKKDEEWQAELTDDQFYVTRQRGTEPPFSGEYVDTETPGIYVCVCCGQPLFTSETKYHSGSGWPSFWNPVDANNIALAGDSGHGMNRTEVLCSRCDAHLGHVFEDGPPPSGQRYCMNSAALRLVEKGKGAPGE